MPDSEIKWKENNAEVKLKNGKYPTTIMQK